MSSTRRLASINAALRASPLLINGVSADDYKAKLTECKAALEKFIDKMNANPIMVRLAWHDSGTYDKEVRSAPTAARGGAPHGAANTPAPTLTMIVGVFAVVWADNGAGSGGADLGVARVRRRQRLHPLRAGDQPRRQRRPVQG